VVIVPIALGLSVVSAAAPLRVEARDEPSSPQG